MSVPPIAFKQTRRGASDRKQGRNPPRARFNVNIDFSSSDTDGDAPLPNIATNFSHHNDADLEDIPLDGQDDPEDPQPLDEVDWGTGPKSKRATRGGRKGSVKVPKPSQNSGTGEKNTRNENSSEATSENGEKGNDAPDPSSSPDGLNGSGVPKRGKRKIRRGKRGRGRARANHSESGADETSTEEDQADNLIRQPRKPNSLSQSQPQLQTQNTNPTPQPVGSRPIPRPARPGSMNFGSNEIPQSNSSFITYQIIRDKTKQFRLMQGDQPLLFAELNGKFIHVSTKLPIEEGTPEYVGFIQTHELCKRFTVCSTETKPNDDRDPEVIGLAHLNKKVVRIAIPEISPSYPISKARNLSRIAKTGEPDPVFEKIKTPIGYGVDPKKLTQSSIVRPKEIKFYTSLPPIDGGDWMPTESDASIANEIQNVYALPSPKNRIFKNENGQPLFMIWKTSAVGFNIKAKAEVTPLMVIGTAIGCIL